MASYACAVGEGRRESWLDLRLVKGRRWSKRAQRHEQRETTQGTFESCNLSLSSLLSADLLLGHKELNHLSPAL